MDLVISAVVIDDHEAVRDGIRAWCAAASPPIEIVATGARPALAGTGDGANADVVDPRSSTVIRRPAGVW